MPTMTRSTLGFIIMTSGAALGIMAGSAVGAIIAPPASPVGWSGAAGWAGCCGADGLVVVVAVVPPEPESPLHAANTPSIAANARTAANRVSRRELAIEFLPSIRKRCCGHP